MELVRQTLADNGFKLSAAKRVIMNSRAPKLITGIRLGAAQLRAPKKKLREIRAGVHNLEIGRLTTRGRAKDIASLKGQIMHIKSICDGDASGLEIRLKRAVGGSRPLPPE